MQRATAGLCVVAAFALPVAASAEVKEVQIARGFAIPHLPIMIMEHDKLLEKHALAAGLGEIRVTYSTIGGGSVMNDSLISGALSFGVGGPPPILTSVCRRFSMPSSRCRGSTRSHRPTTSWAGPHTFTMVYATSKFHDANPKTFQAFLAAIKEAIATINRDKNGVARTYPTMTNSKESVADIVAILDDPLVQFTMTPVGTMKFADFMYRIEPLKNKPNSWQDYFFEESHYLPGS